MIFKYKQTSDTFQAAQVNVIGNLDKVPYKV